MTPAVLSLAEPPTPAEPLAYNEPCYLPVAWRNEVEAWTRTHREARAQAHWAECFGATKWTTAVWHARRAKGQTQRFVKLANCGETFEAQGDCDSCGCETRKPVYCGLVNLCPRCRGREARRLRKRVRETMADLPDEQRALASRARDPWGWKLLTLTVPHGRGIQEDTRALARKLWPQFWRQFKAHVSVDRGETAPPLFVRCLEIAKTGSDDGHAHYHVAVFAPFVHRSFVNLLWGTALTRAGYTCPEAPLPAVFDGSHPGAGAIHWHYANEVKALFRTRRGSAGRALTGTIPFPVTDLRQVHGDVSHELVKYLVKDVHEGQRVAPRTYARIYQAVDGMRRLSSSRPLRRPEPEPMPCPHCAHPVLEWTPVGLTEPDTPPRPGPMMGARDVARDIYVAELHVMYREAMETADRQRSFNDLDRTPRLP